jgi:hypothetical protein
MGIRSMKYIALRTDIVQSDIAAKYLCGARAGFMAGECYCCHCAKDMDEDGLFPEERAQCIRELAC